MKLETCPCHYALTYILLSIRTFGPPTRVQSDRGTEFKGAVKTFFENVWHPKYRTSAISSTVSRKN